MSNQTQNQLHTPYVEDWGEMGAPPPPPKLIRQCARMYLTNVVRRLDFEDDDDDDDYDTGLPLPLVGSIGEHYVLNTSNTTHFVSERGNRGG